MKTNRLNQQRWFRSVLSLAFAILACAGMFAQSSKPITREGLEKALRLGGLKSSELVEQITRRGVDFVLTPQLSAELSGLGAAPEVIQAVGANYHGSLGSSGSLAGTSTSKGFSPATTTAPARTVAPSSRAYPGAAGIYVKEGGSWMPLSQESTGWHKEGFMKGLKKVSGGLIDAEATGQIAGAHSAVSFHSPASLLIRPEPGLTVDDYMIVHMHAKHDNREFKTAIGQLHSNDQIAFHSTRVEPGVFMIDFSQGSGDYAVLSSRAAPSGVEDARQAFVFTFQVLP